MSFQEINVREFSMKPFKMIGDQWMLVTAGDQIKYNTMTASWGGIGVMWGKNVAVTVIRPQRYTKEFVESHDCFKNTKRRFPSAAANPAGRSIRRRRQA